MVDGVDQAPGDLLQDAEIEHEETFRVYAALDRHAHPIVVAVQRLALVPAEGDEVGRGEDQIVLADLDSEVALHGDSPQRSQPPSSITTNIAAQVRSAVAPGFRRLRGSRSSASSRASARRPSALRIPPARSTSRAR